MTFYARFIHFNSRKCIWKWHLRNGDHFVEGEMKNVHIHDWPESMRLSSFLWGRHCISDQGPVSISEKTSFRKISSSLEAARFVFRIVRSLCNLTGTSAAVLPMCLSNFKAIRKFKVPIPWLRDFTRSYEKTYFRILRGGPDSVTDS